MIRCRVLPLLLLASAAQGQTQTRTPAPVPTIAVIDSAIAQGDSTRALALLAKRVRADGRDAIAWHRQGMLAWAMARPRQARMLMKKADIALLSLADTALRLAAHYAPDSARFYTDLGRYMLASGVSTVRFASYGMFDEALGAAKRAGNPVAIADAADEVGMVSWRRYEAQANRRQVYGNMAAEIDPSTQRPDEIRNYIDNLTTRLHGGGFFGESEYRKAVEHFEEALKANASHPRALRHLYMAHAEVNNWEELKRAAQKRLEGAAWDPYACLALGLAAHRLNEEREAASAFDSAMVFLSEKDRERYNALARVIRPSDSTRLKEMQPDVRDFTEQKYWILSDPLWLTPQNEHHLEFLSRVTYADIRWTSEDFQLLGADTDRGDIHIRYGPPDEILSTRGGQFETVITTWIYRSGLIFVFREPPTFGVARHSDYEHARRMTEENPVRWDNVATDRRTDSVTVQLSRFRAEAADSGDFLMVAQVPLDSLMRGVDLKSGLVDVDFQMFDDRFRRVARDSSRYIVTPGQPSGADLRAWRRRVGRGAFVYRVEAHQPDAMRGARAVGQTSIGRDTSFLLSGFGMSDVVVAEQVMPREGSRRARWSDFNIVPGVGRLKRRQSVALLWETYELGVREGSNRYRVEVSLTKVRREGALGMAATIIGGVAGSVGVSNKGKGKVTLRYDRNIPVTPAAVDYLTVDIGEAPTGRYTLRVEVIDTVTGRRVWRERIVSIAE